MTLQCSGQHKPSVAVIQALDTAWLAPWDFSKCGLELVKAKVYNSRVQVFLQLYISRVQVDSSQRNITMFRNKSRFNPLEQVSNLLMFVSLGLKEAANQPRIRRGI